MNVVLARTKRLQRNVAFASIGRVQAFSSIRSSSTASAQTSPTLAGVSEGEIVSSRAYCTNLLQKFDAPSHTISTFIPSSTRDAYLALRALNVEVARIGDATSNPTVGAMRMQFWKDAIAAALAYTPRKEPVSILLSYAAATLHAQSEGRSTFSKAWLNRIITTRQQHLHNPPYPNIAALETYAENTYSTLLYLTLSALPLASVTADHLASHIGKAQGITAVLRGLPLIAFPQLASHSTSQAGASAMLTGPGQQGAVTLPLDVMASAGLREEDVFRHGASAEGLRDAIFSVATRANDHLITAREMLKNLHAGQDVGHEFEHSDDPEHPRPEYGSNSSSSGTAGKQLAEVERGFGVFMPAIATQMWLDRLQKCDFDVFKPELRSLDWKLPWKTYWAFTRRKF